MHNATYNLTPMWTSIDTYSIIFKLFLKSLSFNRSLKYKDTHIHTHMHKNNNDNNNKKNPRRFQYQWMKWKESKRERERLCRTHCVYAVYPYNVQVRCYALLLCAGCILHTFKVLSGKFEANTTSKEENFSICSWKHTKTIKWHITS